MLTRLAFAAVALVLATHPARAADLPVQTELGAIFTKPSHGRVVAYRMREPDVVISPWVATSPHVPGYYGRPGDFHYQSYYGTPPDIIFGRLPYACPYFGYGRAC